MVVVSVKVEWVLAKAKVRVAWARGKEEGAPVLAHRADSAAEPNISRIN